MWHDIRMAFAFLSILPAGAFSTQIVRPAGKALAWSPLVGLVIGLLVAGVLWIAPLWLAPYAALLVWVTLTGGLHLDGFADSCDALFATSTAERRLEIMKDPRVGSWAVIGLALLLLGKFVAIGQVSVWALIAVPVAARWAMTMAAWRYPYARREGTGGYFRQGLGQREIAIATGITLATLFVVAWFDWRVLALALVAPLAMLAVAHFAMRRLGGGITGDIYGTICEVTELLGLLALALLR